MKSQKKIIKKSSEKDTVKAVKGKKKEQPEKELKKKASVYDDLENDDFDSFEEDYETPENDFDSFDDEDEDFTNGHFDDDFEEQFDDEFDEFDDEFNIDYDR